jgi:lipopolysaccharide export system permease protein
LYIQREELPSYIINQDTTKAATVPGKFNPTEIFNSLPVEDKRTILLRAVEDLKDASNFLTGITESMKVQIRSIKRYDIDWHKKLTLPFACLVFFFIGAPLGAIIRKGGLGTPSVISIFFFVIWYVISLSCEKLVEENLVGSITGMWASSYILLPIGIFLTYKASTDSVIMNIDTYLAFFRKIKNYIYRIAFQVKEVNPENKTE